jgi:hypothetical protein
MRSFAGWADLLSTVFRDVVQARWQMKLAHPVALFELFVHCIIISGRGQKSLFTSIAQFREHCWA